MSEHTPGPWKVFTSPDGTKIIGIGDRNGEGVTDCGFGIWRGGSQEAHANARLIAAAPDMLVALKRLIDNMPRPDGHGCLAAIVFAERIIAQADGRPTEALAKASA